MNDQATPENPAPNAPSTPAVPAVTRPRARRSARAFGKWLRRSAWIAGGLGVVALLVVAWLPKPVPIEVIAVRRGPMQVTVDDAGKTRVKDRYVISAPLGGNLARIDLRPDDAVKKGDVLARLLPMTPPLLDARSKAEAEARVAASIAAQQQAQAAIERARLAAEHARTDREQNERLAASGALSAEAAEHARFEDRLRTEELASARFAGEVADHELGVARAALGRVGQGKGASDELTVTSPVDGRVLKVLHESAGVVQPGAPLLEIGDPAALEIVSDVLTSDAVHVRREAHVQVERWGGDAPLAAHVRVIEPSAFTRLSALGVEEQRVNVIVDIDEPRERWRALGEGYRVETRIVIWQSQSALTVPPGALFRRGEGWAVFVVSDGIAHARPVEIGRRSNAEVEVRAGLAEGEIVVDHPSERVADGARVVTR